MSTMEGRRCGDSPPPPCVSRILTVVMFNRKVKGCTDVALSITILSQTQIPLPGGLTRSERCEVSSRETSSPLAATEPQPFLSPG